MKRILSVVFIVSMSILLSGCFGETYSFHPPGVMIENGLVFEKLTETNSEWKGEGNVPITKVREDWFEWAKEQPSFTFKSGENVKVHLEHGDYLLYDVNISLWTTDKKEINLYVEEDDSIQLPKLQGEYVFEMTLESDRGESQYVGNLKLQ